MAVGCEGSAGHAIEENLIRHSLTRPTHGRPGTSCAREGVETCRNFDGACAARRRALWEGERAGADSVWRSCGWHCSGRSRGWCCSGRSRGWCCSGRSCGRYCGWYYGRDDRVAVANARWRGWASTNSLNSTLYTLCRCQKSQSLFERTWVNALVSDIFRCCEIGDRIESLSPARLKQWSLTVRSVGRSSSVAPRCSIHV
jgi:hypothetical protein